MTPTANLASTDVDVDHSAAPAADAGPFVLNLCSSTTPMALAQTELPELKRFTFFVSRRFEEGRERFRLHMGFFASQAEAEEWLSVVRDIYPGAWAGEAPGKKLRARAAEAAAVQAGHAVGPQTTAARPAAPPPIQPTPPAPRPQSAKPAASAPKVPTLVPTLHPPAAAPGAARASAVPAAAARAAAVARAAVAQPAKAAPQPPPKRSATAAPASRPVPPAAPRAPAQGQAAPRSPPPAAPRLPQQARTGAGPAGAPRPGARPGPVKPAVPAPAIAASAPARPAAKPPAPKPIPQTAARAAQPTQPAQPATKTVFANSNVKEVMAALDRGATGETRVMPSHLAEADTTDDSSLTDTQVLRFLETRREADDPVRVQAGLQVDAAAESGISLLKPDDTGTRRALKEAVSHNEPVAFAVQLQWSVQPVELDKVPPLAIFSAYTLYSVEGSREGRRWYGLRLGFFNDAISAKQVAYYVRSEFTAVAVVPVSPQERARATEDNRRFAGTGAPRKKRDSEDAEFKLIDSDEAPAAARTAPAASAPATAQSAPVAVKPASAKQPAAERSDRKSAGTVNARERRTPQTLEETLEILGANELAIDNGSRETLSDTGVRHLRVEVQKNTPFSRLLERLSERVRKA
ncbi:MAG TPA: hypothetical protein VGG63_05685 [Steroidobacteraceae bacterium]|jgi:hypothetical protein